MLASVTVLSPDQSEETMTEMTSNDAISMFIHTCSSKHKPSGMFVQEVSEEREQVTSSFTGCVAELAE